MRSPAASMTTSPATTSLAGISIRTPSRRTVARSATESRNRSAAVLARYSWTKSSVTLISTRPAMMKKLVSSPLAAETALANSRMSTNGLRKRERYWSTSARSRFGAI